MQYLLHYGQQSSLHRPRWSSARGEFGDLPGGRDVRPGAEHAEYRFHRHQDEPRPQLRDTELAGVFVASSRV